jgi:hypothetical protein
LTILKSLILIVIAFYSKKHVANKQNDIFLRILKLFMMILLIIFWIIMYKLDGVIIFASEQNHNK